MSGKIEIRNRKAFHEFNILDKYIAGMVLFGTEIKSIRNGGANLSDSYCTFKGEELWVKNIHISEYGKATHENHEPKRTRKLLLNKRELKKLKVKIQEKGFTLVPIRLFISERAFAKLEIAVAKGKKLHDKRQTLKEKDIKKEMDRSMKR